MAEDVFGFSEAKTSTADRLKSFKPSQGRELPPTEVARVDAVSERMGFKSRELPEAVQVAKRRKKEIGPTTAINTRAPQRVAVPFIGFCEENRFSYWEGIEELMRRAGLLPGQSEG